MLPHAGGEYVYLRRSYGEAAAFAFGWMRFFVAGSGSIAILGTGFATSSCPPSCPWTACGSHRPRYTLFGPRRSTGSSARSRRWRSARSSSSPRSTAWLLRSAAGCSRSSPCSSSPASPSSWAASSCCPRPRAGRTSRARRAPRACPRRPRSGRRCWRRSGPTTAGTTCRWRRARCATRAGTSRSRSLAGMALVMAIYCLANLAYFYALPWGEVVTSNSTRFRDALPVATRAAQTFLGEWGGRASRVARLHPVDARGSQRLGPGERARPVRDGPRRRLLRGHGPRSAPRAACRCGRSESRPSGRACWRSRGRTTSSPTAWSSHPGSSTGS